MNDHYRIASGKCDGQGLPETVLHNLIMTEASEHPKGIVADIFSPEYIRQHGVIHMYPTTYDSDMQSWSVWIKITDPAHISMLKLSESLPEGQLVR